MIDRAVNSIVTCPFYGHSNVVKYGLYKGTQRYWCKDCKVKFTAGKLWGMRTPQQIFEKALELRRANATYAMITKQLQDMYGVHIAKACLSRWCNKYGITPSESSPHMRRDKGVLIKKLVTHLSQGTRYTAEHILSICGYSPNTKVEDTQLLKSKLIVYRNGGYIINDRLDRRKAK